MFSRRQFLEKMILGSGSAMVMLKADALAIVADAEALEWLPMSTQCFLRLTSSQKQWKKLREERLKKN